jgi:hypothetical protein
MRSKKTVSNALRDAVLNSGQSLAQISRATAIDLGNLSRFVRGQRWLSPDNLDVLCNCLRLTLVRPAKGSRGRRGSASRKAIAAALAADPSPVNDATACLLTAGHTPSEARRMIAAATASGRQFNSAADLLSVIFQSS